MKRRLLSKALLLALLIAALATTMSGCLTSLIYHELTSKAQERHPDQSQQSQSDPHEEHQDGDRQNENGG